jgi:hypothetical protein
MPSSVNSIAALPRWAAAAPAAAPPPPQRARARAPRNANAAARAGAAGLYFARGATLTPNSELPNCCAVPRATVVPGGGAKRQR